MAPVTIPQGYAFIPRRTDVNVAAQLLDAAQEVEADLITSVRTVTGGYHVTEVVAERYRENAGAAAEEAEGTEPTGEVVEGGAPVAPAVVLDTEGNPVPVGADGTPVLSVEPLPVTADSTHAEIDDYAGGLDPKVEFPANTNKADKIALLEAARTPQTDGTAE